MTRHAAHPADRDLRAEELDFFGLDDASDRWLDVFRDARRDAEEPLASIAGFDILGETGRGGQGVVYRARRRDTGRLVAIKRLHAEAADARRRFDRERDAMALLDHECIVRVACPTPAALEPAVIMEWIDGVPISDWARAGTSDGNPPSPRPIPEVLDLFIRACEAVRHAHQRGVIHRDLKPSNVLVETRPTPAGSTDIPRILDFGLAALHTPDTPSRTRTDDARLLGTPLYASPEQIAGGPADARSDIYTLALMLHECLTGELPFDRSGPLIDVLHRVMHEPPRRASASGSGVTRDLDAVLLKALEKEPARRYQSMDAFLDDLKAVRQRRPVSARLASPWYTARKAIARHKFAAGAACAALLCITGAAIVSTILAVRLDRQHRQARAVASFLHETLSSARPGQGGAGATVLDAVAAAHRRAEVELASEPEVAVEVYQAIGDTYRSLWKFREAIPVLERAAQLAREVHGPDTEPVARALSTLGHCLANTSDPRAADVQREALRIRRSLHRGDHRLIAESHMRLGYALYRAADPRDDAGAEAHLTAALAMNKRLADTLGAAQSLHNLGYFQWRLGRIADAIASYEEALTILADPVPGKTPADQSHAYVECLTGYASLLSSADRLPESAAAYERLVPILRREFPEEAFAPTLRRQARICTQLDRHADAAAALEELLDIHARIKGPEHADTLAVRAELREVRRRLESPESAPDPR